MLLGLGFTFFSGAVEAWLVDALDRDRLHGRAGDGVRRAGRSSPASAMLTGSVAGGLIAAADQPRRAVRAARRGAGGDVRRRLPADARRRLHAREGRPAAGRDAPDRVRLDRLRLAGAGGEVADGARRCSPAASASTPSTRSSRTCWSSTATRRRTRSPASWPRSSPARRSSAGSRRRASAGSSTAARRRCSLTAALSTRDAGADRGRSRASGRVLALIVVWGLLFAATMPIRQAYINGMIPSQQRATILSFDSMMGSTRRRLGAAGPRPRRRRLGLRARLPARRRDLGARAAVPRALAAPERARRLRHRRPQRSSGGSRLGPT